MISSDPKNTQLLFLYFVNMHAPKIIERVGCEIFSSLSVELEAYQKPGKGLVLPTNILISVPCMVFGVSQGLDVSPKRL